MVPEAPVNTPGLTREELRELIREELAHLLVRADGTPYRELPIEPVFTLEVACAAVPCSERALFVWLKRGGFEALYRWVGNRRYRMLPAPQVRWIREQMVRKRRRTAA
jgi:hypothetical protein